MKKKQRLILLRCKSSSVFIKQLNMSLRGGHTALTQHVTEGGHSRRAEGSACPHGAPSPPQAPPGAPGAPLPATERPPPGGRGRIRSALRGGPAARSSPQAGGGKTGSGPLQPPPPRWRRRRRRRPGPRARSGDPPTPRGPLPPPAAITSCPGEA